MRTEEDKLTQAPIEVILGGKSYKIAPLVIRDSREWRKKVVAILASLPSHLGATTDEPEAFEAGLRAILVSMPDTTMDLLFEYAKGLNRDEIEGVATEEEIATAFEKLIEVAFPLSRSLPEAMVRFLR